MQRETLKQMGSIGFKIVILKNKYANPTPLGYSDFNLVVAVRLGGLQSPAHGWERRHAHQHSRGTNGAGEGRGEEETSQRAG